MSKYSDGRRLEYAARDDLVADGYFVIRAASSKGKVDLAAFKQGEILFVQCKTDGDIGPAERAELRRLAALVGAVPLSAAWHKDGRAARTVAFTRWTSAGPAGGHPWTPDHAMEMTP
jgi:hypothetical protein